jgi:hypothetical protein
MLGATSEVTDVIKGSCLCGEVAYEVHGKISEIGQCHCSKCRKVTGSSNLAVFVTAIGNLKWVRGEDLLSSYKAPLRVLRRVLLEVWLSGTEASRQ